MLVNVDLVCVCVMNFSGRSLGRSAVSSQQLCKGFLSWRIHVYVYIHIYIYIRPPNGPMTPALQISAGTLFASATSTLTITSLTAIAQTTPCTALTSATCGKLLR